MNARACASRLSGAELRIRTADPRALHALHESTKRIDRLKRFGNRRRSMEGTRRGVRLGRRSGRAEGPAHQQNIAARLHRFSAVTTPTGMRCVRRYSRTQ
jgi:hypothetical protein